MSYADGQAFGRERDPLSLTSYSISSTKYVLVISPLPKAVEEWGIEAGCKARNISEPSTSYVFRKFCVSITVGFIPTKDYPIHIHEKSTIPHRNLCRLSGHKRDFATQHPRRCQVNIGVKTGKLF